VAPARPLFVNDRGLHYALVNTAALRALDADRETLAAQLDSTGSARLSERASGVARRALAQVLEPAARRAALLRAAHLAVSVGLTSVHAVEGGELFSDDDVKLLLAMRETLPLHVVPYWSTDDVEAVAARGLTRMGGDILCDGALGARTAALLEDYADHPGARGEHLRDAAAIQSLIERAEQAGLQVGVHAIGDRAVRGALAGLQAALAGRPNALRHRIDHFGIVWPEDLEMAARVGVAVATQPAFMAMRGTPGGVYEQRLGVTRVRRTYPLRDFLEAGLRVAAGSDSPVGPAAPLVGLQAALLHPVPGQSIDLALALSLYTSEAAWLGGEEHVRGTLEPGMAADFVVLARDPFTVAADQVGAIPILATYVAGVQVFGSAPPWQA
jgi:predicted amidohydrolase YtcJ